MTSLHPGDVGLVRIPFTDLTQAKKRPALVLFSRKVELVVKLLRSTTDQ